MSHDAYMFYAMATQIFTDPLFFEGETFGFTSFGTLINIQTTGHVLYENNFWHLCTLTTSRHDILKDCEILKDHKSYVIEFTKQFFSFASNIYGFTLNPHPPYQRFLKTFISEGQRCFLKNDLTMDDLIFKKGTPIVLSKIDQNNIYALFSNGEEYRINESNFETVQMDSDISMLDKAKQRIREKESQIKSYPEPPDLEYLMGYVDGLKQLINS